MRQCAVLLKDTIIIRIVFGSYQQFVEMVEHLNNAIHWHAMAPKRPDTMAEMVIAKCVRNT